MSIVILVVIIYYVLKKLIQFSENSSKGGGKSGSNKNFDSTNRNNKPLVGKDSRVREVMRRK